MTQENKNLILQDLCARLPYGVKVQYVDKYGHSHIGKLMSINVDYVEEVIIHWEDDYTFEEDVAYLLLEEVKPYLRPMSSMTEEEKVKLSLSQIYAFAHYNEIAKMDWLNEHHFDYRGLIDRGLAIEVTENNNPYKD